MNTQFAAAVGAAVLAASFALGASQARGAMLALHFSGTYTNVTATPDEFDSGNENLDNEGLTIPGATTLQPPAGLQGSAFSGTYYYNNDISTLQQSNALVAFYGQSNQGVSDQAYVAQDALQSTQSSLMFNLLGYQIANRSSNTVNDEIYTSVATGLTNQYAPGYHFLPSQGGTANATAIDQVGGSAIVPLKLLGVDPSTAWAPIFPAFSADGSTDFYFDPDNLQDGNYTPFFYYANDMQLAFIANNPLANTLLLPGPGTVDLSQFAASLSFQLTDNGHDVANEEYRGMDDSFQGNYYQNTLSVVGTITSAYITTVPEPSGLPKWVALGTVVLLSSGLRVRKQKVSGKN